MAEIVNEILEKFAEISREEKQIALDMEAAQKEYKDYCESSDKDLAEKIQEIRTKMSKLQYYIDYAREHAQASDLEQAATAFETSEGALESLRQTIKLESHNDMNAESLYTKATGQKLFYEQKIEQTRKLIEGSKVQAKRQFDSDVAAINDRRAKHDAAVKEYVKSEEFKNYLKTLMFDKSAFNSIGTANLPDKSYVSLGQRRVKLSVPFDVEQDLSLASNGEYNAAAHTIGAPMRLSVQNGSILYLDYDERNHQYLFGGIQRLLLNIIKYVGHNITDCLLCEPTTNSPDCLGHISVLGKGINPFIVVPQTVDEIESRIRDFCAKAETIPTPDFVSRILVMHDFPEKYDADVVALCTAMFKRVSELGVLVVLTHDNSIPATPQEQEIRELALSIRSRNGGFWIEKLRESFFWYSAPSDIPEDIRREFVDRRRQMATQQAAVPVQVVAQPMAEPVASVAPVIHAAPVVHAAPVITANPVAAPVEIAPEPAPAAEPVHEDAEQLIEQPAEDKEPEAEAASAVEAPSNEEAEEPVADTVEEAVEESAAAPEEEAEYEAADDIDTQAEEPSDERERNLKNIVIGSALGKKPVYFDINGDISYICGKRCEERTQITDMIVSSVICNTHPDDTELWIFDFGSGELMRYAENPAAHIRFLVSDGSAETAFDAIDTLDRELEYRINLFEQNGWKGFNSLPDNEYLPRVVVVVNEFPVALGKINKSRQFGRNYTAKLNGILKYCGYYGIHFVLIGENFSENGMRPACFKNCSVQSALALASCDLDASDMFDGFSLREGELASVRRIPAGSAYVAVKGNGGALARLEYEPVTHYPSYSPIADFNGDADTYVEKYPLIIDRKSMPLFEDHNEERLQLISERENGETLLFFGEPCTLAAEYPVHLYNDFGENILALVPAREKSKGVGVVFSVMSSLAEQTIPVEILAFRSNPVYKEMMQIGAAQGIQVFEGDTAIGRAKQIAADIAEGRHSNAFEIILGADTMLSAVIAEDIMANFTKALVKGPSLGVHFMLVASNLSMFEKSLLQLFKYKLVFPCAMVDAEKVLRDANAEIPENAFRLSSEGSEITVMPYII